jgi:anti-sigma-K factor RskA
VAYVSWHASERLQSQVATTRAELDSLTRTLDSERRWNGLLNSRDARLVALESTPADSAGLRGRVMYDPASRRAVVVLDHAAARPGSDYELWAIRGGTPVSLGLLRADPSGLVTVRIEDAGPADTLQAFAVSLERAGGSPNPHAPSGPVVMLGKLGG